MRRLIYLEKVHIYTVLPSPKKGVVRLLKEGHFQLAATCQKALSALGDMGTF